MSWWWSSDPPPLAKVPEDVAYVKRLAAAAHGERQRRGAAVSLVGRAGHLQDTPIRDLLRTLRSLAAPAPPAQAPPPTHAPRDVAAEPPRDGLSPALRGIVLPLDRKSVV